jgi:hypothetical protein
MRIYGRGQNMTDKTTEPEATGTIAISDNWLDDIFTEEDAATEGSLNLADTRIALGNGAFMRGSAPCEDFDQSYGYSAYD